MYSHKKLINEKNKRDCDEYYLHLLQCGMAALAKKSSDEPRYTCTKCSKSCDDKFVMIRKYIGYPVHKKPKGDDREKLVFCSQQCIEVSACNYLLTAIESGWFDSKIYEKCEDKPYSCTQCSIECPDNEKQLSHRWQHIGRRRFGTRGMTFCSNECKTAFALVYHGMSFDLGQLTPTK